MSNSTVRTFFKGFIAFAFCCASMQAREARTFFVQPPKKAPEKVFLINTKTAIEVTLPSRNLSPEVDLPKGELVFAILPKPLEEGQELPKAAPRVKIPETWSRCYLLFSYDKSNKFFPLKAVAINASGADFPKGSSRMINATSEATVAARFGKEKVELKPGKAATVKAPRTGAGAFEVEIFSKKPDSERRSILCQSKWVHEPESRQLILAVDVPGQKKPRVFSLSDVIQKKEK